MSHPCKDRDIKITPTGKRVQVSFAGKIIADTDQCLDLAEGDYPVRIYVPMAAIDGEVLVASDYHTDCPFKGEAAYHHLKSGDALAENAVWYYPQPCPLVEAVRDHVAFWGDDVRVEIVAA